MPRSMDKASARNKRKSAKRSNHEPFLKLVQDEIRRRPVQAARAELKPLTDAQRRYMGAINANRVIFGTGPAGTGKTWFAAAIAAEKLRSGEIEKIIITRPAIEAGESLGFLPGDQDEKYEPYFRPVRDALEERLGSGEVEYRIKSGSIEARPLAYLRGATLKGSMILADEMQNCTVGQMKMLLTRIGQGSTMIINGDTDQCDLPDPTKSGLRDAVKRLRKLSFVGVIEFDRTDIVRDSIVQDIVEAYSA